MANVIERNRLPLKEWRLRKHFSFRQLARAAGISTETLMRLEKGGKVLPVTARKIVDALGVSEDQVLELRSGSTQNINEYSGEITDFEVPDLTKLLEGITPQNRHALVDWGEPIGKEVW